MGKVRRHDQEYVRNPLTAFPSRPALAGWLMKALFYKNEKGTFLTLDHAKVAAICFDLRNLFTPLFFLHFCSVWCFCSVCRFSLSFVIHFFRAMAGGLSGHDCCVLAG